MNIQLQQQITPELSLYAYNDIPVFYRIIGWLFRIFAPLL